SKKVKTRIANCKPEAGRWVVALLAAAVVGVQAARSQDTNHSKATIPVIQMDDVPLRDAIKNLARATDQNFILDPRLSGPWDGPDGRVGREPTVTVRWENLSAGQALDR